MLPPAIPRKAKRESRWKSPAHRAFVRSRACCRCGSIAAVECAHVRIGSGAGISQKPDDWNTVGLCKACHTEQHTIGERSFWHGADIEGLIAAYCRASPKSREIAQVKRERGLGA